MFNQQSPIGVFDSGIGGLSVLRHLLRSLPGTDIVYLGDTARVPYGNKSAEAVSIYAQQCAAFLLDHNVSMIVVACNTASAIALDVLKSKVTIPVVDVIVPAAREAIRVTESGRIGVIGTRATVASNSYAKVIEDQGGSRVTSVFSEPCPLFVPLVEEGLLDHEATRIIALEYLRPLLSQSIDTLVLGCTHYPLLIPLLESIAPNVHLVDSGRCAAFEALRLLGRNNDAQQTPSNLSIFVTDHTPRFHAMAEHFLGMRVNDPVRVSVDHCSL